MQCVRLAGVRSWISIQGLWEACTLIRSTFNVVALSSTPWKLVVLSLDQATRFMRVSEFTPCSAWGLPRRRWTAGIIHAARYLRLELGCTLDAVPIFAASSAFLLLGPFRLLLEPASSLDLPLHSREGHAPPATAKHPHVVNPRLRRVGELTVP